MFFLLCIDSYQQCRLFHGLWSRCTRRLWLFVQSSTGLCHLLRFGFQIVQIDQRWMFCTSTVRHASPSWRHARKSIQQRLHRLNNIILNFFKKKSNHRFQSFPCWSIRSLFSFFSSSLLFELLKVKVNDPFRYTIASRLFTLRDLFTRICSTHTQSPCVCCSFNHPLPSRYHQPTNTLIYYRLLCIALCVDAREE